MSSGVWRLEFCFWLLALRETWAVRRERPPTRVGVRHSVPRLDRNYFTDDAGVVAGDLDYLDGIAGVHH